MDTREYFALRITEIGINEHDECYVVLTGANIKGRLEINGLSKDVINKQQLGRVFVLRPGLLEDAERTYGGTQDPDAHKHADTRPSTVAPDKAIDINELKPLMGLDPTTKVSEGARGVPLTGLAAWAHVKHGISQKRSDGTTAIYTDGVVRTPGGHTLTLQKGKVVEARMHTCVSPACPICRAPALGIIRY